MKITQQHIDQAHTYAEAQVALIEKSADINESTLKSILYIVCNMSCLQSISLAPESKERKGKL